MEKSAQTAAGVPANAARHCPSCSSFSTAMTDGMEFNYGRLDELFAKEAS